MRLERCYELLEISEAVSSEDNLKRVCSQFISLIRFNLASYNWILSENVEFEFANTSIS